MRWTAEMDAELARLRRRGMEWKEVAEVMGLRQQQVESRAKKIRHLVPAQAFKVNVEKAEELIAKGLSLRAVAFLLGVDDRSLQRLGFREPEGALVVDGYPEEGAQEIGPLELPASQLGLLAIERIAWFGCGLLSAREGKLWFSIPGSRSAQREERFAIADPYYEGVQLDWLEDEIQRAKQ